MKVEWFLCPHGHTEQQTQELEVADVLGGGAGWVEHVAVGVESNLVRPVWSWDEYFHDTLLNFLMQREYKFKLGILNELHVRIHMHAGLSCIQRKNLR